MNKDRFKELVSFIALVSLFLGGTISITGGIINYPLLSIIGGITTCSAFLIALLLMFFDCRY